MRVQTSIKLTLATAAVILALPSTTWAGLAPEGCCQLVEISCFEQATETQCEDAGGAFIPDGTCTGSPIGTCEAPPATETPTATPTTTATATTTATPTPTNTPIPNGGACTLPEQCASTFCADGVCCDTACDGPGETCIAPGLAGECTLVSAPVPAASPWGLVGLGLTLVAVAALTLARRAR